MKYVRESWVAFGLLIVAAPIITSCGPQGGTTGEGDRVAMPAQASHRFIIKLRDPSADPARPELLHELSRQAGLSLVYVRPLSGGAHLLGIEGAPDPNTMAAALSRLQAAPAVEYVEPDQLMHHQSSRTQ